MAYYEEVMKINEYGIVFGKDLVVKRVVEEKITSPVLIAEQQILSAGKMRKSNIYSRLTG